LFGAEDDDEEAEEAKAAGPETTRPAFRTRGPFVEKEELEREVLASEDEDGVPAKEGRREVFAVRRGPMFETRRAFRPGERDSAEDMGTSSELEGCVATRGAKRPDDPGAIENEASVGTLGALARSKKGERGRAAEVGRGERVESFESESIGRKENGVEGSEESGER
jgi:hypothetical protein